MRLSDEQLRVLANLASTYDAWMQAQRELPEVRPWLSWKTVKGRDYLYEVRNRRGLATSLGPRSAETEARFDRYRELVAARDAAASRLTSKDATIQEQVRMYRALHLPQIDSTAGAVLREADRRRMLGACLLVVGTNTMAAYEIEARNRFATGLDSTIDFDMAWAGPEASLYAVTAAPREPVMDLLKEVDEQFTVNAERPWQARNAKAYEVEILLAPSLASSYPQTESIRPSQLPEQEWLLLGQRVSHVVIDRSGRPARIVAPDPRWMALHKCWLSDKPGRSALKIGKDRAQGLALLKALREDMPQFPLDDAFLKQVPLELRRYPDQS